jgi:putative peptidoglycan lipid II flippase
MIRQIATVSAGTLSSRLLGFVRDTLMASLLGAGPTADAFLFAFQLINVARRLLSEGAFNAMLVPAFLRIRRNSGDDAARRFAGGVLGTTAAALVGATIAFGLAMPYLVGLLAPGFAQHDAFFAVTSARLMLPYLAFVGPVAVIMALLNAAGRVAQSAFTPLLFNLLLILVTLTLLIVRLGDAATAAKILATTVGAAGLAQAFVLAFPGTRMARPIQLSADGDVLRLLQRTLPGALAQSGPQLLVVAGAISASLTPGSVAAIYFANRLIELPLGIVGVAAGTVVLTKLSDGVTRAADAHALQSRAVESALALALPASIGLAALAQPIVILLFRHGAFTADDAQRTALALAILSTALPAHALTKILAPNFFARENFRFPLIAMIAGLGVTVAAALVLQPRYLEVGVATAIALGAWTSVVVLIVMLLALKQFALAEGGLRRLALIMVAGLIMGAALYAARVATGVDHVASFAALIGSVAALIAGGLALYLGLLQLLGIFRVNELLIALRR